MRAAVYRGAGAGRAGRLALETRPRPDPEPGEVRLRVGACGLCGSDLHLLGAGLLAEGRAPGHEMAGTIDAVGRGVEGWREGDAVAVEPFRTCGRCAECRAGRGPLCRSGALLGVHAEGGLADYALAPAGRLFAAPEGLAPEVAALAEPLAVAVHGLRRGGLAPGQRVLVLGAGAVGLLTVFAARGLGAGEVLVTARHAHQAERARALGADRLLGEAEAGADALARLGREAPVDLVVETVGGRADTLALAAAAVRPGGAVAVLGLFLGRVALDALPLLLKEVTLAWSYCYRHGEGGADFDDALRLLAAQPEAARPLVTHAIPLDEAERAVALAADKAAGALKVSVRP